MWCKVTTAKLIAFGKQTWALVLFGTVIVICKKKTSYLYMYMKAKYQSLITVSQTSSQCYES